MQKRIFVAGASGAIGQQLVPMLLADGWSVTGMTRSQSNAGMLRDLGAEPVVGDLFDAAGLREAVIAAKPWAVMHQVTDLPDGLDPALMAEASKRNARVRDEGTRNLIAAAGAAGAERLVAQSLAFVYAPGAEPFSEDQPLNTAAEGAAGVTPRGVASLEEQLLACGIPAVILRYGLLYGPGTGFAEAWPGCPLHVREAARAAVLALNPQVPAGVYNIAETEASVRTEKARTLLGWKPVA